MYSICCNCWNMSVRLRQNFFSASGRQALYEVTELKRDKIPRMNKTFGAKGGRRANVQGQISYWWLIGGGPTFRWNTLEELNSLAQKTEIFTKLTYNTKSCNGWLDILDSKNAKQMQSRMPGSNAKCRVRSKYVCTAGTVGSQHTCCRHSCWHQQQWNEKAMKPLLTWSITWSMTTTVVWCVLSAVELQPDWPLHDDITHLCTGTSMVQRQSTWHLCCSEFPVYILASDFTLLRLLTWWCHGQFAPPSVNCLSSQQQHPRGILCLILSVLPHQCYSSEVDSRQNYSCVHTSNLTEFVSASVTQHFCSVILNSLDLRHVNDDSNTN